MDNIKKKFSKIYDKNIDGIYRFIFFRVSSEEIAQDLTSETFIKALHAFEEKEVENPRAFLYRIAKNLVIDHYRERDRTQTISIENLTLPDSHSLEENVLTNSDMEMTRKALSKIKEEYKDVITLHYINGLSIKETAETLDKSNGAVRVMLHRALNSLREEIREA